MTRYAEGTTVPVERTRIEMEETLRRFGADAFSSGYEGRTAFIMFRARGRFIRLTLALPSPSDFRLTPTGKVRVEASQREAYEAECRRRWRSLALLVKAKLAAVADGIVEFEAEFLAHVVLPDGQTFDRRARDAIAIAYERGEVPRLLPPPGEAP